MLVEKLHLAKACSWETRSTTATSYRIGDFKIVRYLWLWNMTKIRAVQTMTIMQISEASSPHAW